MTAVVGVPQLLLPGQAAAPDGPVDLAGMYLMHHGFRRDLNLLAELAATVPAPDCRRWRWIAARFELFASVLHKHHHGEDIALWPLLAERGADQDVLDALEAEHGIIDPLLAAVRTDVHALADGTGGEPARERVAAATAQLRDALAVHLAHEESDGMTLVQRHLTPADWHRLDVEVFAKDYTPREIPAAIGWVASGLPTDALYRMPGANALVVAFARVMARRMERRQARVFGGAR